MLLFLGGCAQEPAKERESDTGEVRLRLLPTMGVGVSAETTRAVVDNTYFLPMLRYGLWVEALDTDQSVHADNTQWYHNLGYDNILADRRAFSGNGSAWSFTVRGGNASSSFGLFSNRGEKVHVYAIYPFRSGFDPFQPEAEALPFTVGVVDSLNYDYMYSGPIEIELPGQSTDMEKILPFKHVMTLLEFQVSTTLVGSLQINSITLEAFDAGGNPVNIFCMSGTYSARTGAVDGQKTTNRLAITYNKKVAYKEMPSTSHITSATWTSFGFIFPAVEAALTDGTRLEATFEFDYKNQNEEDDDVLQNGGRIVLNLGSILTDGAPQGLMADYRYIYPIEIDNFIKYEGYPKVQPWYFETEEEGGEEKDKIYDIIL